MFLFRRLGVARNFLFLFHRTEVPCHRPCVSCSKKTSRSRGIERGSYLRPAHYFSSLFAIFLTILGGARRPREFFLDTVFTVTIKFRENGGALAPFLASSGSGGKNVSDVYNDEYIAMNYIYIYTSSLAFQMRER